MKLEEVLNAIPEAERSDVLAQIRVAKSADDVNAIAQRYDIDIDAEAIFKKYAVTGTQELDDEDLENVAGGSSDWGSSDCSCSDGTIYPGSCA